MVRSRRPRSTIMNGRSSTNSLTKTLGLCGLRLGWLATHDQVAREQAFAVHRYAVMVTTCSASGSHARPSTLRASPSSWRQGSPPAIATVKSLTSGCGAVRSSLGRRRTADNLICSVPCSAELVGHLSGVAGAALPDLWFRGCAITTGSTITSGLDSAENRQDRCQRPWPGSTSTVMTSSARSRLSNAFRRREAT